MTSQAVCKDGGIQLIQQAYQVQTPQHQPMSTILEIKDRIELAHQAIESSDSDRADGLYKQALTLSQDAEELDILILVLLDYSIFCQETGRETDSAKLQAQVAELRKGLASKRPQEKTAFPLLDQAFSG